MTFDLWTSLTLAVWSWPLSPLALLVGFLFGSLFNLFSLTGSFRWEQVPYLGLFLANRRIQYPISLLADQCQRLCTGRQLVTGIYALLVSRAASRESTKKQRSQPQMLPQVPASVADTGGPRRSFVDFICFVVLFYFVLAIGILCPIVYDELLSSILTHPCLAVTPGRWVVADTGLVRDVGQGDVTP